MTAWIAPDARSAVGFRAPLAACRLPSATDPPRRFRREAATRLGLSHEATSKRWQSLRARMRENGSLRALALEESA